MDRDQEEAPAAEPETTNESDALLAEPGLVHLSTGVDVQIRRMRTREFFKLVKILLHGASTLIPGLLAQANDDDFLGQLGALIVWAVPEAPEETLDFIRAMVQPFEVTGPRDRNGQPTSPAGLEAQRKNALVVSALDDPEIEDTVTILEAIVIQEREEMAALGKRLRGLLEMGQKAGQIPA